MGTHPLLANLFLFCYERDFMDIYLLTDAIFISILQVLKKGGIYREYTCFL